MHGLRISEVEFNSLIKYFKVLNFARIRYKVSTLIYEYASAGLEVHHSPIEDGGVPSQSQLAEICEHLHKSKQPILIQ